MTQLLRSESVPGNGAKNLFETKDIKYVFCLACKLFSLKIGLV